MTQNSSLIVTSKIYNKDSSELVDYDFSEPIINKMNINKSGALIRSQDDIYFQKQGSIQKNEIELIKIMKDAKNDIYYINTGKNVNGLNHIIRRDSAFLVYKKSYYEKDINKKNKRSYKLSKGDLIKLGRVSIEILKINLNKKKENNNNKMNISNNRNYNSFRKNSSYNSFMVNGHEVIKGSFSSQDINDNNEEDKNSGNAINIGNENLTKKKIFNKTLLSRNLSFSSRFPKVNKITLKKKKNLNLIFDKFNFNSPNYNKKNNNDNTKNKKICRVCYCGEESPAENPLINPCECKGSMKYIHYECLKSWLDAKIESSPLSSIYVKEGIGMSYCTDDLVCELCKAKFPDYINYNNKLFNINFYKTKFEKYLIFRSIHYNNKKYYKFIHIVSFDNIDKIVLGRANECDISFPEPSISRYHCFIYCDKEKEHFYLDDNCSRFGSLVLIQNQYLEIINNLSLKLQKNKTYIKIMLSLPFNLFSCLCVNNNNENKKVKTYQQQNEESLDIYNFLEIKNIFNEIDSDENDGEDNINNNNNDNNNDNNNNDNNNNIKNNNNNNIKNNNNNNNIKNININNNNVQKNENFISNLKGSSLKLLPYSNRKSNNNFRLFKVKVKSKINFKTGKRSFNNKNNLLNRNSFNDHSTSVDTQKLLNTNRINVNSFREGNLINLNRLNNNSGSLRFGNSNILSFRANRNKKTYIQNLFSNNKENNE